MLMLWGSYHFGSHVLEVSYCTCRFGTVIQCDMRKLLLLCLLRDNLNLCVIEVHSRKATLAKRNSLEGLAMK